MAVPRVKRSKVITNAPDPQAEPPAETAAARYATLLTERQPYLNRAIASASLTIPALMLPLGSNGSTTYANPFQSVGAEGVNNLAAKLHLALFPPGTSFFRLPLDDAMLAEIAKGNNPEATRTAFEEALGKVERICLAEFERRGSRMALAEYFKQLIVSGNACLHVPDKASLKLFKLDRYVSKRDTEGNLIELILQESVSKKALTGEALAIAHATASAEAATGKTDSVDIYTWVRRVGDTLVEFQEIGGTKIPNTDSVYPVEKTPWIVSRFTTVHGEDYGRGYVEEYIGSLSSLDALTQAIVEGSAQAAKVLWFVNEGGITSRKNVAQAPNGAVLAGQARDVTALQLDKFADFKVAQETAAEMKRDLQRAFLLLAGVQRNAERVTAEEIQTLAQELENSLGGIYSVQTQELQLPLATRLLVINTKAGKIPPLPKGVVIPQIVTGIAGLGRNTDIQKLRALVQGLSELFGPQTVSQYIHPGRWLQRIGTGLSIDVKDVIRTDEEVQQAVDAANKQALAEKAVAPAINVAGQAAQAQSPAEDAAETQ